MLAKDVFLERLKKGPVLLDGAMGTELMNAGLSSAEVPELWNLTNTAAVQKVHLSYDKAGAEILYTNSFGGNAIKLAKAGQENKVEELNTAAVAIARKSQVNSKWVAGSMGPLGELMEPYGDITEESAKKAFFQQAQVLLKAGADIIVVESHTDLNEASMAVAEARRAGAEVILASMTFEGPERDFRTIMGATPEKSVETLLQQGATVVGANCGKALAHNIEVIKRMHRAYPGPLMAKFNAGLPNYIEGKIVYSVTPEEFARELSPLVQQGVALLGGCCGTTPQHIAALAQSLK